MRKEYDAIIRSTMSIIRRRNQLANDPIAKHSIYQLDLAIKEMIKTIPYVIEPIEVYNEWGKFMGVVYLDLYSGETDETEYDYTNNFICFNIFTGEVIAGCNYKNEPSIFAGWFTKKRHGFPVYRQGGKFLGTIRGDRLCCPYDDRLRGGGCTFIG